MIPVQGTKYVNTDRRHKLLRRYATRTLLLWLGWLEAPNKRSAGFRPACDLPYSFQVGPSWKSVRPPPPYVITTKETKRQKKTEKL